MAGWGSIAPTYADMCKGGKGVVHPPGNDLVRYLTPFQFSEARTPLSKFFFREAKIIQILMKIAEIKVLFTISGYISLFFDLYNTILAKFQALFKKM